MTWSYSTYYSTAFHLVRTLGHGSLLIPVHHAALIVEKNMLWKREVISKAGEDGSCKKSWEGEKKKREKKMREKRERKEGEDERQN